MKNIVMFILLFMMFGCVSKKVNPTVIKESNVESQKILYDVFSSELYFEKDKVGQDKTRLAIKYLDAYPWEKRVLNNIYKNHKKLWSEKQSKDFEEVLQNDKYLSLCSDRRYWENLELEEHEPERDILHSIILLRYLNNLSHGCVDWVRSDGKIKDENRRKYINAKYVFSLLPHKVLINTLLFIYAPKELEFKKMLQAYHKALHNNEEPEVLKRERLIIELYKHKDRYPNYRKREE